jgi:hypothetical protein
LRCLAYCNFSASATSGGVFIFLLYTIAYWTRALCACRSAEWTMYFGTMYCAMMHNGMMHGARMRVSQHRQHGQSVHDEGKKFSGQCYIGPRPARDVADAPAVPARRRPPGRAARPCLRSPGRSTAYRCVPGEDGAGRAKECAFHRWVLKDVNTAADRIAVCSLEKILSRRP